MNPTGMYFHKDQESDYMVVLAGRGVFLRGFLSRRQTVRLDDGRISNGVLVTWYDQDTDTAWVDKVPSIQEEEELQPELI